MDIYKFINYKMCTCDYSEKILKYCHRQEIDEDMSYDFKF